MMKKVDFSKIGYQIWDRKLQILVTVFLFFLLSIAYTLNFTVPFYQASVMLELTGKENSGVEEKRLATYSSMLQSETMLEQTIQTLELNTTVEELQKNVSAKPVSESNLIQITVKQENPQDAARIANELAEGFIQKAKETYHINNVTMAEEASVSERAYYMLPAQDILLFCLVGLVLSIGYVGIISIVDQIEEQKQAQKVNKKKEEATKQKKEVKKEPETIQSNKGKGEKNETKSKRGRKKNS